MTTDDKLQHFMDVSMQSAMQKKASLVDEFKSGLDIQFENHKTDADKKYEVLEKTAMETIRRDYSKDFATQNQAIKRELTHKKDELKDRLFDEVNEKLKLFFTTDNYKNLLIKEIKYTLELASTEEITIFIDPVDEPLLLELELLTGAKLKLSAYSFGRGMRAIIPSQNILIDNSFNTKINDIREEFTINL